MASDLLGADVRGTVERAGTVADRVLDAFGRIWPEDEARGVVLVEASDLARLRPTERVTEPAQFDELRTTALKDADDLFGRLLAEVDPETDGVLVVGPTEGRRGSSPSPP